MRQKLAIASVLMEDPKIMIFDEPFNGVDEESKIKIVDKLISIKTNKLIIITSHNREDIKMLCDEIYTFKNGVVGKHER